MAKVWNVGVVGLNIGRSHIVEGYSRQSRASTGCLALCDLNRRAAEARRRRVRHRAPHHVLRRPPGDAGDRHRRHLHAAGSARSADRGRAPRRQARGLREAARRFARRGRRLVAVERDDRQAPDADLPVPLRRRRQKAKRIIERGLAGKPYLATVETAWNRTARLLRRALARQVGDRARRRPRHARDPPARHADLPDGADRLASSAAPRRASMRSRSRIAQRSASPWRCGALATLGRDARLAARDQPPALLLRERDLRERSLKPYQPGDDPWADHSGQRTRSRSRSTPRSPTGRRCRRASTARCRSFTTRSTTGAPLPVTLADARRSLELVTALYHSAETGAAVSAADRRGPPEICELAPASRQSRGLQRRREGSGAMTSVVLQKVGQALRRRSRSFTASICRSSTGRVRRLRRSVRAAASRRCCA